MAPKRRTPAKRTPAKRAPVFAKPEAKASVSSRSAGPRVSGSARIEVSLIKIGSFVSTSRTVNRGARRGGLLGKLFGGLQAAGKAAADGAAAGSSLTSGKPLVLGSGPSLGGGSGKAAGGGKGKATGPKGEGGGPESWDRFRASRPDLFGGGAAPGTKADAPQPGGTAAKGRHDVCPECQGGIVYHCGTCGGVGYTRRGPGGAS